MRPVARQGDTIDAPSGNAVGETLLCRDLKIAMKVAAGQADLVRGVSLSVARRETLVVLGESGSGKSLTARAMLGLLPAAADVSGAVMVGGEDLMLATAGRLREIRGARIGFVPQDPSAALSPVRRVGAQMAEVLGIHAVVPRAARRARVLDLLARVGLSDPRRVAQSYAHELSGGMRQRVAIAIAISCEPEFLVADEPTTALDVTTQARILALFADLIATSDMGLLLVTHDVGVADQMADRIAVMYDGRIVEFGSATSVLEAPAHPYTRGLLAAAPRFGSATTKLRPIPGSIPSPTNRPSGCSFRERCVEVVPGCESSLPVLVSNGPTAVACSRIGASR